ncbi:hypothetical protein SRRS_07030 [Sporomusa rhizae]|uniref:hypothetical protein n=1 Tax=Sporomusa rhizae TaxID=357999 RepID=UPI003529EBBF
MSLAQQKSLFGEPLPASSFRSSPVPPLTTVQATARNELNKPENRHPLGKVFQDPRPDFQEDSDLWVILLIEADKVDVKLWDALLGFRCVGTRLFPTEGGGYVIRPHIDPTGDCGWKSIEEYKAEAARWLAPFGEQVKELLKNLARKKASWKGDDGNK